jgi:hypothetical protein
MARLATLASELRSLPPGPERSARLSARLQHLSADAEATAALRADLDHPSMVRLLAEMGLPDHTALLPERAQRAGDLLLPRLAEPGDLYRLLDALDLDQEDAAWVRDLPPDLAEAAGILFVPAPRWVADALRLLGHRAAGVGLGRGLLRLGRGGASPFLGLPSTLERFVADPSLPGRRARSTAALGPATPSSPRPTSAWKRKGWIPSSSSSSISWSANCGASRAWRPCSRAATRGAD